MNSADHTLKGEYFFQKNLLLYVNRATETYQLPLHSHDFIELAFVAEGKGFHYTEQEVQQAFKGQLYFIPVGVSHVFRPSSPEALKEPLVVYNCLFTPGLLDGLASVIPDAPIADYLEQLKNQQLPAFSITDRNGSVESLFLSLHREYSLPQTGSGSYLQTLFLQLIVTLYRLQYDELQFPVNRQTQFRQILHYIQQEYAQDLTLSRLARTFDWSERHLQRLFKAHTGQTFHHFLQNVRIQKSCSLLSRQLHSPIPLIAEQVGYRDTKTFSLVFKRIIGKTPGGYRQEAATAGEKLP
ncbi:AraC family transcriptional regulator [Paenibacillus sp. S150]|uniref:AraC family transcriptional regulator n=1 Tax=Paenibacillus sp. S150 TaxID=2749826 RepID=UPI001C5864F7|nr:AraC family transcriptional regulator [Paenibacillus sp. S150]MBW4085727.1 helix-turn-helix transcriptional regulator [Paenibacillus sp. S150]